MALSPYHALIDGSTQGIGRATAEALAVAGSGLHHWREPTRGWHAHR